MKKLITVIGVSLMAMITRAQTNDTTTVWQNLTTATNYGVVTYGLYRVDNHKVGGGALLLYNINTYVGAGIGAEYVGQFNIVTGNAQLRLPTQPLMFTHTSLGTNLVMTPFAYAGIGKPTGGTSGSGVSTHEATGLNFDLIKIKGYHLGIGGAYIFRQNAGLASGDYLAGFITLH